MFRVMHILPTLIPFLSHVFQFVVAHILHGKRKYVSIFVDADVYLACTNITQQVHSDCHGR